MTRGKSKETTGISQEKRKGKTGRGSRSASGSGGGSGSASVFGGPQLAFVPGGLNSSVADSDRTFVSAYVTDTRLMGVLAVYACWEIDGGSDLHQFFYIDCEEFGLEVFKFHRGEFGEEARLTEQALTGGLGAAKVPLDEASFRWLIGHWRRFNVQRGRPLPKNAEMYDFVFDGADAAGVSADYSDETAGDRMLRKLMDKTCVKITGDYQAVNYFLMRCFGQDYEGA